MSCVEIDMFFRELAKFSTTEVQIYLPANNAQISELIPEVIWASQMVGLLPNWCTRKDAMRPAGKSSTAAIVDAVTMS